MRQIETQKNFDMECGKPIEPEPIYPNILKRLSIHSNRLKKVRCRFFASYYAL